jgi:hypothetical protein
MTLGFIFLDLGPAGVITGTMVALGFGTFIGWVPFTWAAIVSLTIIGGIIIVRSRT